MNIHNFRAVYSCSVALDFKILTDTFMFLLYSRPIQRAEFGIEMRNLVVVIGSKASSLKRRSRGRRRGGKELCLQ